MAKESELKSQAYRLAHPGDPGSSDIELAIFKDHRFSFYYWVKWSRQAVSTTRDGPPALVTIDWHRDLAPPAGEDRQNLERIGGASLDEIRRYARSELDPHNDEQVLSAAWLNLVGDIYLLKNYGMDQEETFSDRYENVHRILEFNNYESFVSAVPNCSAPRIYLDIDLDYFIKNKVAPRQRKDVQLYTDEEIREVIKPENKLFRYLLEKLAGITIATEPRYCGGIRNSSHILDVVLNRLFTPDMNWRHPV